MNAIATLPRARARGARSAAAKAHRRSARSAPQQLAAAEILLLPIDSIDPNPNNPRDDAAEDLDQLAPSIEAADVITPITVRPMPDERYRLVCGERRWRAAKIAGKKTVPAIVRKLSDGEALELSLIENLCRKGLNPIQIARGIARLHAPAEKGGAGKTLRQINAMFGKGNTWACTLVGLLKLPEAWQRRVASGAIAYGAAKLLIPHRDSPTILERVEREIAAAPALWATPTSFRRGLEMILASQKDPGRSATPKPPRAPQARLGEVQEPEDDSPAEASERPFDGHGGPEEGDAGQDQAGDRRVAGAIDSADDLVETIVGLVNQLTSWAQLQKVNDAVRARAAELQK